METVLDSVRRHARERGGDPVYWTPARTWTFAQLDEASSRIAQGLKSLGIVAGDRLVVTGRNLVGRVTVGQTGDAVTTTVAVAAQPTAITMAAARVIVTSANLDANFAPIGPGIVTAIDPKTMQVLGTAQMSGTNSDRRGSGARRTLC
jgi:long-chain acyl-CoA synthetase